MSQRIVVTGIGILSAAGRGVDATERALVEGSSGLGSLSVFESQRNGALPVAEVASEHVLAGPPRSQALASVALAEAIAAAGLKAELPSARVGLSLGCCVGGMPETEVAVARLLAGEDPDPTVWLRHELAHTTVSLADAAGLLGPRLTVSTACASGAQAIANGADLILGGLADVVVAGGVDALCRLTLSGFASLLLIDPQGCRPFARGRGGMSLGEGAAFLVLETAERARTRGARVLATLAGWANTCDAHHATAPDPEGRGAEAAMRQALAASGLTPREVDYVNAHGTGTRDNDLAEGAALGRLLDPKARTAVSSTKRIFGHTLGAAGAIEAVVSVLAIERGFLPGNQCQGAPDPDCTIRPVLRSMPSQPRVALSNSFGFGGNNAVLCFTDSEVLSASASSDGASAPSDGAALPALAVTAYALAGARDDLALPAARRVDLPKAGHHKRRARLAGLATALVRAAASDGVPGGSAVYLGTALGSLTETEAFVESMIRDEERAPMPRAFSASVHNAASSRPAIALGARGDNQTFVHGGLSFAHALFAAARRAARGESSPAFVGALDEATPYVERGRAAGGCPGEAGEGGAVLRLAPLAPASSPAALARIRLAGLASPGTDAACAEFLSAHPEVEAACAVLATSPDLVPGCVNVTPLTGDHPSRGALAAALAVAVLSGELPFEALGLDAAPQSLAVALSSRFGEAALFVVDRAP